MSYYEEDPTVRMIFAFSAGEDRRDWVATLNEIRWLPTCPEPVAS